ncbi:MAG: hypothetical protein MH252_14680, partial [Thermosynechococcaceae cyanobacterium MS004]|nr:hypothetical protein [Thermosynechococcaceae cyanobacterium MS004]
KTGVMEKDEMMTSYPPDWVKDALFHQIFLVRSRRSQEPQTKLCPTLNLEGWDSPAIRQGYMDGNLWGVIEPFDYWQA